jgi:hypothetical protein
MGMVSSVSIFYFHFGNHFKIGENMGGQLMQMGKHQGSGSCAT